MVMEGVQKRPGKIPIFFPPWCHIVYLFPRASTYLLIFSRNYFVIAWDFETCLQRERREQIRNQLNAADPWFCLIMRNCLWKTVYHRSTCIHPLVLAETITFSLVKSKKVQKKKKRLRKLIKNGMHSLPQREKKIKSSNCDFYLQPLISTITTSWWH